MAIALKFEEKAWWVAVVFGLGLAAILSLSAEYGYPNFQQKRKDIDVAKAQLSSLTAEIEKGRAAERKLSQFREEVKKLELELQKLLQVLPPERDTEDLIKKVEGLIHQGDFSLLTFRTNEPIPRDFYKEYPFNISLNGTYHNLALFFSRMSNFSRIINVEDLRVHGIDAPGKTIGATFVAKTFIYIGDSAAGQPRRGAGGPVGPPRDRPPTPRGGEKSE
ncbi:MAG: type 4a pilus biogenesis protein PilO [Thermoanaerobaculia bacterium]